VTFPPRIFAAKRPSGLFASLEKRSRINALRDRQQQSIAAGRVAYNVAETALRARGGKASCLICVQLWRISAAVEFTCFAALFCARGAESHRVFCAIDLGQKTDRDCQGATSPAPAPQSRLSPK